MARRKSGRTKRSVLLIDRSVVAAQALRAELEQAGYQVKVLIGGWIELDDNFARFPFNDYDVVACEYNFEVTGKTMFGIQMLLAIRQLWPKQKLVLMSDETGVVTIAAYNRMEFFGRLGVVYSIVDVIERAIRN